MAQKKNFYKAILDRNLDGMNEIINRGVNVSKFKYCRMSPLIYALYYINPEDSGGVIDQIISRLIDIGADVNATHETSLMSATMLAITKRRSEELILKLIHAGANVNFGSRHGMTTLIFAIKNNCGKKVIETLIERGANVNNPPRGKTPLYYAVTVRNDPEIIEMVLEAGADITACEFTKPLLALCCKERCTPGGLCRYRRVTDILIEKGVDLEATDRRGNTIIHEATCNYVFYLAQKKGTSVNKPNNYEKTPLLKSLIRKDNDKVDDLLLIGADPNWRDSKRNNNVLHISDVILSGLHINLLLYHGTNMFDVNNAGETPIDTGFRDTTFFGYDSYLLGMKHLIKHYLLYENEQGLDEAIEALDTDHYTKRDFRQFIDACRSELNAMRDTLLKEDMSIYQFCHEKRFYRSRCIPIEIDEYLIGHDFISVNFPNYKDVILMRLKDNGRKNFKDRLIKTFYLTTVKSFNAGETDPAITYDCLEILSNRYLDYKELFQLISISFDQ